MEQYDAAKRAEIEAQAAAAVAEIEANAAAAVAKIAAQADLDVVQIQAEAADFAGKKDAAIVGYLRDTLAKDPENLTNEDLENLLLYYYIQQWNGTLPETYLGSDEFYSLLFTLSQQQGGTTVTPDAGTTTP